MEQYRMRAFYSAATNLVQGLFAAFALIIVADVASPTFNVVGIPNWSGGQATIAILALLTISLALGVVMHTVSRAVFHSQKQQWTLDILASAAVRNRLAALGTRQPSPGGPTYEELAEDAPNRIRNASAFMHGIEYQVMIRAPEVFANLQVYRDQHRLARAFIIPCAALALILPFWAPVGALDGVGGAIGPLPIIRTQAFLLGILAWVTLEGIIRDPEADDD